MATICKGVPQGHFDASTISPGQPFNASEESVPGPFSSKTSSGKFLDEKHSCDSLAIFAPGGKMLSTISFNFSNFCSNNPKNKWPKNIGLFVFFWCDLKVTSSLVSHSSFHTHLFTPTRVRREANDALWSCALNHWMPRVMPNGCDNYTPEIYY